MARLDDDGNMIDPREYIERRAAERAAREEAARAQTPVAPPVVQQQQQNNSNDDDDNGPDYSGLEAAWAQQNKMFADMMAAQQQQEAKRQARADELFGMWKGRASQALTTDRNAPHIREQVDAYSAGQNRAKRDYLADLAERSGPVVNMLGEERLASERLGQQISGFEAELIGRELEAKRNEIAQALAGMAGMLSGDQQASLQAQLAQIDSALNTTQMHMGQDQFLRDLGLRAWDRENHWDFANRFPF